MSRSASPLGVAQHAPHNAMDDADEIVRFHDRCSDLMRQLLDALADAPDRPRTFPQIEETIGWPPLPLPGRPHLGVRPLGDVDGSGAGARGACRTARLGGVAVLGAL